ncbi:MAG: bifunctional riboflavin kinase/FAD synthetase [Acidobacteriota bacterium]
MRICHGLNCAELQRPTIITIGIFDGLHLGHQLIMRKVVARAKETGMPATVLTFSPHPRAVLHPETAPPLLQTFEQKVEGMGMLGIDQVVVLEFTRELADLTAEAFTRDILCTQLQAQEIYLGKGFAFGRGREGNIEKLQELSARYGFLAAEVPEVVLRGRRISSTLVRRLIKAGRVNLARRMLGRPYGMEGTVMEGRRRGRELQFPTANIIPQNSVLPADGVYVTLVLVEGKWRRSVSNIGLRPTFSDTNQRLVECHLLDFEKDLYGKSIRIRLLHRLRDEKKFTSISQLQQQIARDSQRARRYFQHPLVHNQLEFQ